MNSLGVIGTKKVKIMANAIYMTPTPDFIWEMNLDKEVSFDASASLAMDRKIVRYEWSFGDGQTVVATTPTIVHKYNNLGEMELSLTVTDDRGTIATATETVFVHDPKVPRPNEEDNKTLLGIDSDNDGVRDDVERWIVRVSHDDANIERALNDIATNLQLALSRLDNKEYLKTVNTLLEKRKQCLAYLQPNDSSEMMYKMLLLKMFKTLDRYKAWKKIRGDDDQTPRVIEYVEPTKYSQEDACE